MVLLLVSNTVFSCFDALFNLFSTQKRYHTNESAENLLSQKELDTKYNQIEQVTHFELQRQKNLFDRGKIDEIAFKRNLAYMYKELLFMLPADRVTKLFTGIQLKSDEK